MSASVFIPSTPEIDVLRLKHAMEQAGIDKIDFKHFYNMTGAGSEASVGRCGTDCSQGCSQCCANGTANR